MHNLIPHFIYEQYAAGRVNGRLQAITLFLDISGFTAITESLMLHGKEGAEILAVIINRVFDPIIKTIYEHDGFVTGFAGDALTAVFPQHNSDTALSACTTALIIAQTILEQHIQSTKFGNFSLAIKQGLSAGEVEWGIVGSDTHKTYFFRGEAIAGCTQAEQQAEAGELVLDKRIQTMLLPSTPSLQHINNEYARLMGLSQHTVVNKAEYPSTITIQSQITTRFFPEKLWQLSNQNEFRDVATVFISFQRSPALAQMNRFISDVLILVDRLGGHFVEVDFSDKGGLLLVYFGAPTAHENDIERALRFVLALQTEITVADLQWRAGLTFGTVYAGYVGIPLRDKYTCMGTVVNFAARLMVQAEWGQVLVSEAVALNAHFNFSPLGKLSYKGFAQPVPTYGLDGRKIAIQGFQQILVGRTSELQQLTAFAHSLFSNQTTGVAIIYGDAGMGKSHLSYAFEQASEGQARWLTGQTDGILRSAFNPFIYFLKAYFAQAETATEAENKADFEQRLHSLLVDLNESDELQQLRDELRRTHSILGAMLGLYWADSLYEQLDAKGRYQNMITAVSTLILAECQRQSVILQLEDGHWMDDASHELLTALTRQAKDAPLLILITSRYADDGSQPVYTIAPETATLTLGLTALTAVSIQTLAEETIGMPIDAALQSVLMEKTQANPFYTQQILYYLQEKGLLQVNYSDGQPITTVATETFALPTTLNTLLVARLDRLSQQVKEVVQTASVLGREFELRLLTQMLKKNIVTDVAEAEEKQIWWLLNALQYIFKHILLRDAAYEMQLGARLQELHYLAAVTGEQLYAQHLPTYYGTLAYHYESACLLGKTEAAERAHYYLQKAGQQAADNFENSSGVDYFSRALTLVSAQDVDEQYNLYLAREKIYAVQGNRLAQVEDLTQLTALASTLAQKVTVALRDGTYHNNVGDYEAAIAISEQAYQWAVENADSGSQAQALINSGQAHMGLDAYEPARERYQQAYELSQVAVALTQRARAWGGLGEVAFRRGDYPTAIHYHQQAVQLQGELDDQPGQIGSLRNLGKVANAQGEFGTARQYFLQALQLVQQMGDRPYEGRLLLDLGESDWRQGAYSRAETYLRQSLMLAQTTGDRQTAAASLRHLGVVNHYQGQFEQAMGYYKKCLVIFKEIGDRAGESATLDELGLVARVQKQFNQATGYFEQSLVISREIGNRSGESATLNNLGTVADDQRQYDQAADYFKKSLAIFKEIGNRSGEGSALNNLGWGSGVQGQYDRAIDYYKQSLVISQEIGRRHQEGNTLHNLGTMAYAQGQYDQAIRFYKQSLVISREIGNRLKEGETLNNLGAVTLAQSAFPQAQQYYQQALNIRHFRQEINQNLYPVEDWAGLALLAIRQSNLEMAQTYADQLMDIWDTKPTSFKKAEYLIRTFHFTWQVCQGLGLAQADDILAAAVSAMQTYLDNQPDPAAQAVYLGQVHQRSLWAAWQEMQNITKQKV